MTKELIIQELQENHRQFIDLLDSLNEKEFELPVNNKWTAGQQMKHIYLAVSPLSKGLLLPAFVIKMVFGRANRPSKDYEGLVKKYHDKLQAGGVASAPFIPKPVSIAERQQLKGKLLSAVKKLCRHIEGFTEEQLDACILPHPLLGKLTIREMMYFTMYHVQHHQRSIMQSLSIPASL